jgi:hypothetical protein
MAFGQQAGPPATGRQVQELLQLLHDAGHVDFRDARGPMGFTQRQAGGKFTRDEAEGFIGRLQEDAESQQEESQQEESQQKESQQKVRPAATPTAPAARGRAPRSTPSGRSLTAIPAHQLAAELRRRGWTVSEP